MIIFCIARQPFLKGRGGLGPCKNASFLFLPFLLALLSVQPSFLFLKKAWMGRVWGSVPGFQQILSEHLLLAGAYPERWGGGWWVLT